MKRLKFIIVFLLTASYGQAQFSHPDFDSVFLVRSSEEKNTYSADNALIKSFTVTAKASTTNYSRSGSILGDIASEFMSSLLKNFGSGSSLNISYPAMIKSNPDGYGWNVGLYVGGPGDQNSNSNSSMYWYNGAIGNIIDDSGRISSYGYSVNPYNDKKLKAAYEELKRKSDSLGADQPAVPPFTRDTDVIFGDFKGANMVHLTDLKNSLIHIYMNGRLEAVVVNDRLGYDGVMFVTKKQKNPCILYYRKGLTDLQKADMIRMALFSKFVFSHQ
jgi:hypothetical protein